MPTASASPSCTNSVAASVVAGCRAVPAGQRHPNDQTGQRLESVAATLDGFELARLDLSQRREGDILGAAQQSQSPNSSSSTCSSTRTSSRPPARTPSPLSRRIRLAAHPDLKKAVDARVDAEQAVYLERG